MMNRTALGIAALLLGTMPGVAAPAFSCGSFAMMGGAQMMCSHVDPRAPMQFCTYSWALVTTANAPTVVEGSFLLAPGVTNETVYQGSGFSSEMSSPIVMCHGQKTGR